MNKKTWRAAVRIARPDHWFKNVFMLPGVLLVFFFYPSHFSVHRLWSIPIGFLVFCIVSSSNYVLNEILDAPTDVFHPGKRNRPLPRGDISVSFAWVEWVFLSILGLTGGFFLGPGFGLSASCLWLMAALYNVSPIRLKDKPYLDVLSESVNNPIRLAAGWYATGIGSAPTLSVVMAYWMFGAFLMSMKRYAEYRAFKEAGDASRYRKSFSHYSQERLLESIFFYGALFGMMSGVFMARYRVELVLATPLVAYAMSYYLHLGFKADSPAQFPERLFREKKLMGIVVAAFALCTALLFLDLPSFADLFIPWRFAP